ncbi:MAG TPA: response regulator, partial [Erysipelotrichaceae bacterium]|nr:response regulator [Erysipelotrichaceae bacterium]
MKRTIAIVEDERDLNELMKRYLEKEGYLVKSYYTYESSLKHVGDTDIDLWLLDIMLDEKSGFDLFEAIKSQRDDVPMIFISARDKEFDRIIGLEKGSDDYITKPFNMKEVVLRV